MSFAKHVPMSLRRSFRRVVPRKPYLFNEAVHPELGAIFVAVPKTGTTGIRKQMRAPGARFMIPEPHLDIRQIRDGLRVFEWMRAIDTNHAFPTDPAQIPSQDEAVDAADTFFSEAFKFSIVRNPWARVASLYSRREGVQTRDALDFETFCLQLRYASDTCRKPLRHDGQIDWLTDESGEIVMDHVIRLEELDEGIAAIDKMTDGRLQLETRQANVNPTSLSRNYRDRYSQAAREHVADLFRRDIEAFGYTF